VVFPYPPAGRGLAAFAQPAERAIQHRSSSSARPGNHQQHGDKRKADKEPTMFLSFPHAATPTIRLPARCTCRRLGTIACFALVPSRRPSGSVVSNDAPATSYETTLIANPRSRPAPPLHLSEAGSLQDPVPCKRAGQRRGSRYRTTRWGDPPAGGRQSPDRLGHPRLLAGRVTAPIDHDHHTEQQWNRLANEAGHRGRRRHGERPLPGRYPLYDAVETSNAGSIPAAMIANRSAERPDGPLRGGSPQAPRGIVHEEITGATGA
jgi:hypothetical protein